MFQALPTRHAKRAHQLHDAPTAGQNDHHAAVIQTSGFLQACAGPLHINCDSQQPHAESRVPREAFGKALGATQDGDFPLKQPKSSTTPHSHHAFRLSFSPTGIPTVEPNQHLSTQASLLGPPQHQDTEAAPLEATQHQGPLCTQAVSLASGSVMDNRACQASSITSVISQSSGSTAVPAAKLTAAMSMTPPAGLRHIGAASAEFSTAGKAGDGRDPLVQAGVAQLQQVSKDSPAGADCSRHQAASTHSEAEAEVADVVLATGSPQLELPPSPEASAPARQPVTQSAAESVPLPAEAMAQAVSEAPAQASISVAGDAEGRLHSCTPSGAPCPRGLPLPSTPMLAWLDALGTPGSALLSDVLKPSQGREGAVSTHEEHVPSGSVCQALMDESTTLLAASPELPSEAVLHNVLSPVISAKARTNLLPLSSSSLPLLTDASSEMTSSGPRALPDQATLGQLPDQKRAELLPDHAMPGPLPHHAMPAPMPGQEMPEALPDQATPRRWPPQATLVSASTMISGKSVQATPLGWPRRAIPHMGLPTGLSGLTTPASAAEMHRYYEHIDKPEMHALRDSSFCS